jgi:hypothetical protein
MDKILEAYCSSKTNGPTIDTRITKRHKGFLREVAEERFTLDLEEDEQVGMLVDRGTILSSRDLTSKHAPPWYRFGPPQE